MGQHKEDLYCNFSRKDLQGLCKKYGLPANKSNSEMATSLILYLENKNHSTRAIWEGTRSDFFASGTTKLQADVKMDSTDYQKKDCRCIDSHSGFGNHQVIEWKDLHQSKGSASSKASAHVGNLTQLHNESNSGEGLQENTFSSVVSSSAAAPSPTFTYDVYCDDGIQLYVDLNSNPSDWIENLKAGVRICHHVEMAISQHFHQDIGLLCSSKKKYGSVIIDPSEETDNGQLDVGSYPFTVVANIQGQTEEPEGLKILSNVFNNLDNSEKEQAMLSSKLESGTQDKLPGIASSRRDEKLAVDSGLNVVVQPGLCCDSEGNSVPPDLKCSGFSVHQGAIPGNSSMHAKKSLQQTYGLLDAVFKCGEASTTICSEMQISTSATLSNGFKNSPSVVHRDVNLIKQLNNSEAKESVPTPVRDELQSLPVEAVDQRKFVSTTPVSIVARQQGITSLSRKTDEQIRESQNQAENAGSPRTQELNRGTDSEQKKDATVHSCCNGGLFDLAVPAQKGDHCNLSKSIEDDICRIPSAAVGEKLPLFGSAAVQDRRDPVKGSEELKCLSYKGQLGIPCKRPAISETNVERKRKRLTNGTEGQTHRRKYINRGGKILRSSKKFATDVQSKRRRSSRLFTKIYFACIHCRSQARIKEEGER